VNDDDKEVAFGVSDRFHRKMYSYDAHFPLTPLNMFSFSCPTQSNGGEILVCISEIAFVIQCSAPCCAFHCLSLICWRCCSFLSSLNSSFKFSLFFSSLFNNIFSAVQII
jgi:hypothetical protein